MSRRQQSRCREGRRGCWQRYRSLRRWEATIPEMDRLRHACQSHHTAAHVWKGKLVWTAQERSRTARRMGAQVPSPAMPTPGCASSPCFSVCGGRISQKLHNSPCCSKVLQPPPRGPTQHCGSGQACSSPRKCYQGVSLRKGFRRTASYMTPPTPAWLGWLRLSWPINIPTRKPCQTGRRQGADGALRGQVICLRSPSKAAASWTRPQGSRCPV